jgi:integrase
MTNALATITTGAPASQNPAIVYLASLAEGSRRAMRGALNRIAALLVDGADIESFPWGSLRYQHTQAIRAALADQCGAPTANQALAALRGTLKAAWRLGQMTADEYMAAADLAGVKAEKPDQAAGRALTLGELMALVGVCADGTAAGARDAAMLAVAYSCGLRRAEIVGLDLADYVDGVLTVRGKRNKTRTVPIQNGAAAALADWLAVRGDAPGALFVRIRQGDKLTNERMTTQAVYHIFAERAGQAGVKTFSPHDLRRTFAGDLLDAGADIAVVQQMMGHANVATTAGYDRRGERAKKQAASKLHFPYKVR